MKEFIKFLSFQVAAFLIFTPVILKACDREHEYQQAKYDQWKSDRIAERPYKSFNE